MRSATRRTTTNTTLQKTSLRRGHTVFSAEGGGAEFEVTPLHVLSAFLLLPSEPQNTRSCSSSLELSRLLYLATVTLSLPRTDTNTSSFTYTMSSHCTVKLNSCTPMLQLGVQSGLTRSELQKCLISITHSINQSINQSITQSINQSINQSISLISTLRPESRIANDMQLK